MKQMTRYLFLFSILLAMSLGVSAQSEDRGLTISGNVQDDELKEPMVQATVQLFRQRDSTFVGGTITDLQGNFSIEAPANGIYRLKISSVGYKPIQQEVTLRRNQSVELGELMMTSELTMLKEAVVTGRAAQVVVRKDTLVYNPDAYRTPEGSPIEELIKRIPGAEVDEDGKITVNGKQVSKILLDGKEFMLGDVETALKNIPVNIIQNLKFYDLLGQQSNYERWVNATGRSDTRYNSINSYAMLHVRYRLNMFGGKIDTEGRYDKKWGQSRPALKVLLLLLFSNPHPQSGHGW